MINGYHPDSLPISRDEAINLLQQAEEQKLLDVFFETKKARISPWVSLESGDRDFIAPNNSGIPGADSPVLGVETGFDIAPFTLFFDGRIPLTDKHDPEFTEAYGTYKFNEFRLTLGRENLWWGPGRRGSLILTNNAEALTMLRLSNYPGFELPWIFRHLGTTRLNFFITRLEEDRGAYVPEPMMGGMQLSFAPHENFVLSLNRTFLYGGEGRDDDLEAFFRALLGQSGFDTGSEQSNVVGNQLGGISFAWRTPFLSQPFTLYGEFGGEDTSTAFLIKMTAYIVGIYLPRLGPSRLFDLRFETADNNFGHSDHWYAHVDYPYSYQGRIMGHPMGTDATDYYGELGIYPASNLHIALSTSLTRRAISLTAGGHEVARTYGIRSDYWTRRAILSLEWILEEPEEISLVDEERMLLNLSVKLPL